MNYKFKVSLMIISTALCSFVLAFAAFGAMEALYPTKIAFQRNEVSSEYIKKFNDVRSILNSKYYKELDQNKMLEGAVAGMTDSIGDRYTRYMTKEEWSILKEDLQGEFKGIGVLIRTTETGTCVVDEVYPESPAHKAGILVGDIFHKVDDKDVSKMTSTELVKLIKENGRPDVNIEMLRPTTGETIKSNIVKKKIAEKNTQSKMLENNIAYIRIKGFDENIYKQFLDEVNKMLKQDAKGIVIDVRDNPGGDLHQVVNICDMLLPKAVIVYTEDKAGTKKYFNSDNYALKTPITVLINGRSASASEILASALHDNNRATLIGTTTFGKGLVQTAQELGDGSCIYFTSARYFTPANICIHGKGVEPDVKVELAAKYINTPTSIVPYSDDTQLHKAIEELKKKMN